MAKTVGMTTEGTNPDDQVTIRIIGPNPNVGVGNLFPGDVATVSRSLAAQIMARPYQATTAELVEDAEIRTQDPVVQHRDPAPAKKRRPKK